MSKYNGMMDVFAMVVGRGEGGECSDRLHLHCDVGEWGLQLSSWLKD